MPILTNFPVLESACVPWKVLESPETHELLDTGGGAQTYNDEGQLTVSHTGMQLNWNAEGYLDSVEPNGSGAVYRYGYDCSGPRVWKQQLGQSTRTVYLYGGPNVITELDVTDEGINTTASNIKRFAYGRTIDELLAYDINEGPLHGVTRNQQWSVMSLYNFDTGSIVRRFNYGVFGQRFICDASGSWAPGLDDFGFAYGYTSRRHDTESGLMHFRARFYDPKTGEFISQDPLEYVDGMSLMRGYFLIGRVDPSGYCAVVGKTSNGDPIVKVTSQACAGATGIPLGACFIYHRRTGRRTRTTCPPRTVNIVNTVNPYDLKVIPTSEMANVGRYGVPCGASAKRTVTVTNSSKIGIGGAYHFKLSGEAGGSLGPIADARVKQEAGAEFSVQVERGTGSEESFEISLSGPSDDSLKYCYCVYAKKTSVVVKLVSRILGSGFAFDTTDTDIVRIATVKVEEKCPACPEYESVPTGGQE